MSILLSVVTMSGYNEWYNPGGGISHDIVGEIRESYTRSREFVLRNALRTKCLAKLGNESSPSIRFTNPLLHHTIVQAD